VRAWVLNAILSISLLISALSGLAACGPAPDPLAAPEIHYGEDICDACGMIISDPRFAAATLVESEAGPAPLRFDDIGDLIEYHAARPEEGVLAWYVHDYDSQEWLDARQAYFVRAADLPSPMGHGIAAFADPTRAEAFALEMRGDRLQFEDLGIASSSLESDHFDPPGAASEALPAPYQEEDEG
jgi:copper chaperone NosL